MKQRLSTVGRALANPRAWAYGLFWAWNGIFLAFMFLGFAPQIVPQMIDAVRGGAIPGSFLVYALLLTLVPAIAVGLGLTVLRHRPGHLFTLGYGVEGPLMLLLALRFFVVRDMTPAVGALLTVAGLGMGALGWQLVDRRDDARGPVAATLRLVALTGLLAVGLYASAWLAFYAVPLGASIVEAVARALGQLPDLFRSIGGVFRDITREGLLWLPFAILGSLLLGFSATLFVGMPLAVPLLYGRAWWRDARAFAARYGAARAVALPALALAACAVGFALSNQQPQSRAFALLAEPPASPREAEALLKQQAAIRAGLVNAFLAPQRYVSAAGEVVHIRDIYQSTFRIGPEAAAEVQGWYEAVARPVLYQPVEARDPNDWADGALRAEPQTAAERYAQFFDEPILDGERAALVRAARSTWSPDQARSAWQAVDDREVLLLRQEISVQEQGDWAEVELYEVYQNQTTQRQEVVYYFSLPESAVITGVWLGNSDNRDFRFPFRVAPRGAAQSVYRNEVRQNIDPALVEQIGPRQYRLRAFPVEPQAWRWEEGSDRSTIEAGPPLHLWLTWRVLRSEGGWPLPQLAERRNVYWDRSTVRLANGQPMSADAETWLPASVPATAAAAAPAPRRVDFLTGETVLARPWSPDELAGASGPARLAVVLDRSRSMAGQDPAVRAALGDLRALADGGATVDLYLTASAFRGEEPSRVALRDFDAANILYFGGQNPAELLAQFAALRGADLYDAIVVLTDRSGYELGPTDQPVPIPDAPVWMVHLGGFPLGYDDATLAAIQGSGGGVAASVAEALRRWQVGRGALPDVPPGATADVVDGWLWVALPTAQAGGAAQAAGDGFAPLAARWLILAAMQRERAALDDVATLDALHAIAVEQAIVTPYSSMIVLVNPEQERRLAEAEQGDDRFAREHEAIGETLPENTLAVTGVPEPEEWLLMALAAALLLWQVRAKLPALGRMRFG